MSDLDINKVARKILHMFLFRSYDKILENVWEYYLLTDVHFLEVIMLLCYYVFLSFYFCHILESYNLVFFLNESGKFAKFC